MVRRISVAAGLGLIALGLAGTAFGTSRSQPSDKSCLIAWNSPENHANHRRLLAQRPISGLELVAGRFAINTWTRSGSTTHVSSPACLLAEMKPGRIRQVEGRWHAGQVSGWSWGRWIRTTVPFNATVRLLPDGRLAKIYRR